MKPSKGKVKAAPKKNGRPSKYTEAIADEIVERISKGEPLAQICRDDHMPGLRTVYDWEDARPELSARIARARVAGHDVIAAETLAIADDARNDWMEKLDPKGMPVGYALNGEHVQRSKLRIETRLKLLAKWDPKRYGDKLDIEHTGAGGGPIEQSVTISPTEAYMRMLNKT